MSLVISALADRVVEPGPSDEGTLTQTLADLGRGERAFILGISGGAAPEAARRLFDLGFAPGAEVQMLRRAPLADPVVFRIVGYEVALRRTEARCILVSSGQ